MVEIPIALFILMFVNLFGVLVVECVMAIFEKDVVFTVGTVVQLILIIYVLKEVQIK